MAPKIAIKKSSDKTRADTTKDRAPQIAFLEKKASQAVQPDVLTHRDRTGGPQHAKWINKFLYLRWTADLHKGQCNAGR